MGGYKYISCSYQWAEMKSRLGDKFVPPCYRPMIIDEWHHLRQGNGTVADYIARFDELMIRCNLDEEPMATLAHFRAVRPGRNKTREFSVGGEIGRT